MSWAIWITGLPGSGKSVITAAAETELRARGRPAKRLELDEIRHSITPEPRYTDEEREHVYRALGYMAALLVDEGVPVLIDATAHRRAWRDLVRQAVPRFAEVQLVCPLEVCQKRERRRTTSHAPRDIYDHAGRPGATVPGVDVPYEPALAPELVIDTETVGVAEAGTRVAELAGRLAAGAGPAPETAGAEPAWTLWITGRPGSGKSALAARVAERLREHGARVRVLDLAPLRRFLFGGEPDDEAREELLHRVLAYAAKLLAESGVWVIVDATARRRAWREAARALIPGFAEIQLLCPTEICLERERAVRWGLTFEAVPSTARPDIALDYEESVGPELTIRTDVYDVHDAADRVLLAIRRLTHRLGRIA